MGACYIKVKDYAKSADAYEDYYDDVKKPDILLKLYDLYNGKVKKPKRKIIYCYYGPSNIKVIVRGG